MTTSRGLVLAVALIALGPFLGGGIGLVAASAGGPLGFHAPRAFAPSAAAVGSPFAFVSNFENRTLGNWIATSGAASVVTHPNYLGEPSLASNGTSTSPQIDQATRGIVPGATSLSFQAELNYAGGGTGFVGLTGPLGFVAVVGIKSGSSVWAGSSISSASRIGAIPLGTAQPRGWVDLMAYLAPGPNGTAWQMQVYVDRTDLVAGPNVSVPSAGSYTGAEIRTSAGTVDYTNIIVSTYEIPTTIPGYNNMDGYGQGSGLLVTTLPRFTELTAEMTLINWSVPQSGILSFQINAMNKIGTLQNTCFGFYQLGVDVDTAGHIAPWYVPQNNCVAYYFATHTPHISGGFTSPPGSRLTLRILDDVPLAQIDFQIVDQSVTGANHSVNVTIPYNGTEFEGAYTQIEWQPCCSLHPISAYFLNASLSGLTISGGTLAAPMALPASYMVPFALDVPPSWNFGFYNAPAAGYAQVG